jgi:hypothetical protein
MVVRVLVAGNSLSHWQLVMNQFNQEDVANVIFP